MASAALLVLALLVRFVWGWCAERQLAAEIARMRAAGERLLPGDFVYKEVADQQNAAALIVEAGEKITFVNDPYLLLDEPVWSAEDVAAVRAAMGNHAEVAALLDRAEQLSASWWTQAPSMKSYNVHSGLSAVRQLAKSLVLSARYFHHSGDHAQAVKELRRAQFVARTFSEDTSLISLLVLIAVEAQIARQTEFIAATLCTSPSCADPEITPARRKDVIALIAELSDERQLRAAARRAAEYERALALSACMELADGELSVNYWSGWTAADGLPSWWERAQLFAFLPAALNRAVDGLANTSPLQAFADLDSHVKLESLRLWQSATPSPDLLGYTPGAIGEMFSLLEYLRDSASGRAWYLHVRGLSHRRLAAVRWALRLYEIDHRALPESLDAFVTDYLVVLPDDPAAEPGTTFRYRAAHPAVVYSLGPDRKDDGGRRGQRMDDVDVVYYLDGFKPDGTQSN